VTVLFTDYNDIQNYLGDKWDKLLKTINSIPLHLKESDQEGLQGTLIFDPVGTNQIFQEKLETLGWSSKVKIPDEYEFLGTDVDFMQDDIILEVQFSNYPFLLNNVVRSFLFKKNEGSINNKSPKGLILISKCKMFPSSNSTLYYEQGKKQLDVLASPNVFDLPIRLVGLNENTGSDVECVFTKYKKARYSREIMKRTNTRCNIESNGARTKITLM